MKYFIQSYIDLITNSSTSVFTFATSTESVKDIINAVLRSTDCNLTCDDLFDINIHYNIDISDAFDYYYDLAKDKVELNSGKYPELEQMLKEYDNRTNNTRTTELEEQIYKYLVENCGEKTLDIYAEESNDGSDDYKYSSYYSIEAKNPDNKKYADTLHMINRLFDYDACYC